MTAVKCPRCGRPTTQLEAKLWRCDRCRVLTDGIDDGDIGYGRQDRYAERKEEYEERQRRRLSRRFGDRRR